MRFKKSNKVLTILLTLVLAFSLSACEKMIPNEEEFKSSEELRTESKEDKQDTSAKESTTQSTTEETTTTTTEEDLSSSFTIGMVGDVLFHSPLFKGGAQEDGSYNFEYMYKDLAADVKALDYSIANMEGTLAGPPYSGFPTFSGPDAIATMLSNAGFDLASTANNHSFDKGEDGVVRTLDVLRNAGLDTVGTRKNADEDQYLSLDLNGIKVGISSFTYETMRQNDQKSLNGIPLPQDMDAEIDSFNLENPYRDEDIQKLQDRAKKMRADGNEVVIFIMHWGTEYRLTEDWFQEQYSQALADAGVDLVFACHPHVVEPIKAIKATDSDHEMLCFYSLGNSVSNMGFYQASLNGQTQDGLFAKVKFERDKDGNISIADASYITTMILKNYLDGSQTATKTRVIPARQAIENPEKFDLSADQVELFKGSVQRVNNIFENNDTGNIKVEEASTYVE